jgi:murein DD-endopeptidase MepM/ murein hydrolase activator NlpD
MSISLRFCGVVKRLNISILHFMVAVFLGCGAAGPAVARDRDDGLSPLRKKFAQFPSAGLKQKPILPTPNDQIINEECLGYAARTPGNPTYGMPGWTRNFGARFHKGIDILPTKWTTTSENIEIEYVDNRTRKSFTRIEKVKVPKDEVYAILDGKVVVENTDPKKSGYGKYVVLEHQWADGTTFLSMYCHLSQIEVDRGETITRGTQIGMMGQTSSNAGGRKFLKAIPHMHFEVGRVINENFASTKTSQGLYPINFSGKYDPRNMQPYNPVEFLRKFEAIPYSELEDRRKSRPDKKEKE